MKKKVSLHEKFRMANDEKTSQEMLVMLSKDECEVIRAAVALNKSTPVEYVKHLLLDRNVEVKHNAEDRMAGINNYEIYINNSSSSWH